MRNLTQQEIILVIKDTVEKMRYSVTGNSPDLIVKAVQEKADRLLFYCEEYESLNEDNK